MVLHNIYTIRETGIGVVSDDLTKMGYVEAVVNAANNSLLGGGGVDGAIHRAAGPGLLNECRSLNGCKTGEAKITAAYEMPCRHIIHTVGPRWHGGDENEADLLAACYKNSLQVAVDNGIHTIAFPSISTGIFAYPLEEAAYIAVHAVIDFITEHPDKIVFVVWACVDERTQAVYQKALENAAEEKDSNMYPGMVVMTAARDVADEQGQLDLSKEIGKELMAEFGQDIDIDLDLEKALGLEGKIALGMGSGMDFKNGFDFENIDIDRDLSPELRKVLGLDPGKDDGGSKYLS